MPNPFAFVAPALILALTLNSACQPSTPQSEAAADEMSGQRGLLPTGVRLDPDGALHDIGQFPLNLIEAPERDRLVLLHSGWRDQGIQVIDRHTGAVLQSVRQEAAFVGIAFAPDGRTLYASGGNQDVVYRYDWTSGAARLRDSIILAIKPDPNRSGARYAAGLAVTTNGGYLLVAENLADSLAVIDVSSGSVTQRVAAGRYPYGVVTGPDGTVYVSSWGGDEIHTFRFDASWRLVPARRIEVARHPSSMLLNRAGTRLFVTSGSTDRITVVDTRNSRVLTDLPDPAPAGPSEGSTPNALALSADGSRLYVAEADNNAIAIFDLGARTAGIQSATGDDRIAGRIPTGWYPTGVVVSGDSLWVTNAKGRGTAQNALTGPGPARERKPGGYTLDQIASTLTISTAARATPTELAPLSARVARANNWDRTRTPFQYPPIEHVIYVIKENRTYDQVLGDLSGGDGDTSLVFFPRRVSPNHHALAERFGLFDRFFVNAEVSPDGHNWSMAAYTTDYLQKTVPSNYGEKGRQYDYEGTNRGIRPPDGDDVAEPASGYIWNLAQAKGVTFRNFGEFVMPEYVNAGDRVPSGYRGLKPFLEAHTDSAFPSYDLRIPDQRRADVWLRALQGWVSAGQMPRLQIVRLPNDHTMGARENELTPAAYMADNDLALGRMVEAVSRSPFWRSTAFFVLEDDAQNGPDHVDSHRSVLLVISPWTRPGTVHRWTNTTDVIATMEDILGLGQLSQFDFYGRPLREIWNTTPDLRPYVALVPEQRLDARNPQGGPGSREAAVLDFRFEDVAEEDGFNRSLWLAIKGTTVPFPGVTRLTGLELRRAGAINR
ncbi:MAG TPA: bifunctional YncE family protein/alkaline phosphatase family protein [Gemmatimonadaceae bacterium]|nr:bifunctional YncE family protein/alkaline phosphatase family protein [Gemmatimonadaceae bacterium]